MDVITETCAAIIRQVNGVSHRLPLANWLGWDNDCVLPVYDGLLTKAKAPFAGNHTPNS